MKPKKSPKKSLGQNFLSDPKILSKIAEAADISKEDTVVEIGPGKGSLTIELLKRAGRVIAIEKDEELASELENKFSKEITDNRLQIIVGDVLDSEDFLLDSYKLVGNIPYYITGEIFRKFLESYDQPRSITFVIQKEVAERIVAKNNKESILSISIKAYGEPKYGGIIKSGSFFPKPKVDSAIISIFDINKDKFEKNNIKEGDFFDVVRAGFAHKRKILIKNLELIASKEELANIWNEIGMDKKVRAEDLKVEDWFRIAKNIFAKSSTKDI